MKVFISVHTHSHLHTSLVLLSETAKQELAASGIYDYVLYIPLTSFAEERIEGGLTVHWERRHVNSGDEDM